MTQPSIEQRCRELETLFNDRAPISKTFGLRLSYDGDHRAHFHFPYNADFNHALGGTHGGVLATMLDNAGWFTVAAHHDCWISTVELQVRLLEPVSRQNLVSVGKIVRLGKRISVASMEIRSQDDRLIAAGTGTFTATSLPFSMDALPKNPYK